MICNFVKYFLPLYINDKLPHFMGFLISLHLRKCTKCMFYYNKIKRVLKVRAIHLKREQIRENISAYLDGELSQSEVLALHAGFYSNPIIREEYEILDKTRTFLKEVMQYETQNLYFDISKDVLDEACANTISLDFLEKLRFPLDKQ